MVGNSLEDGTTAGTSKSWNPEAPDLFAYTMVEPRSVGRRLFYIWIDGHQCRNFFVSPPHLLWSFFLGVFLFLRHDIRSYYCSAFQILVKTISWFRTNKSLPPMNTNGSNDRRSAASFQNSLINIRIYGIIRIVKALPTNQRSCCLNFEFYVRTWGVLRIWIPKEGIIYLKPRGAQNR